MEYPFKDLMPLDEATARDGYYKDWTHIDANTFHQISELVKFIREKGYGADTREAIAQALERVYHDALKSGNANMEVSLARKHFKDLSSRLDAGDEHVDAIIADVSAKIGELGATATFKGSATNADILAKTGMEVGDEWFDTTNQQSLRWNGTAWVAVGGAIKLGRESVNEINLASDSVSLSKTTFIKPSYPNYANDATIEKNKLYSFETGVPSNNSQFDSYIMVLSAGQTYITRYAYNDSSPTVGSWVSFFDSSDVFIGGVNASEFTVPEGTHRTIVARRNLVDTELLVTDKSTSYTYNLSDDISPNLNVSRGALSRKKTDWYQSINELHLEYNPIARIDGYYYGQGGSIVTSSTWGTTPKLYLEKNTTYVKKWFSNQGENAGSIITYWRDDGTEQGVYISTSHETPELTTPNDFDFVRMAVHRESNERALLYQKNDPFKVIDNRIVIEPENLSKRNNPLFGKVINVLGDSLTSTDYTSPNWWQMIASETGATFNNYGESSTSLAHQDSTHDIRNGCMVERYVNMDKSADGVVLMGGTNDNAVPIGTWESTDIGTFFGALNILIKGLLSEYAGKPIIIMTPIQPATDYATNVADAKSALLEKSPTDTLTRQLRAEAIKLKCAQYGVTCIDLFNTSGISGTDDNRVYYRPNDTLHPSALGQNAIRTMLKPVLEDKFS